MGDGHRSEDFRSFCCGQQPHAFSPERNGNPMTKRDLAHQIAEEVGEDIGLTLRIVQRAFDGIIETLQKEGRVELRNFGVFQVKKRKARTARNPRTGEKVEVPSRTTVTFRPGREMLERVGQTDAEQANAADQPEQQTAP